MWQIEREEVKDLGRFSLVLDMGRPESAGAEVNLIHLMPVKHSLISWTPQAPYVKAFCLFKNVVRCEC